MTGGGKEDRGGGGYDDEDGYRKRYATREGRCRVRNSSREVRKRRQGITRGVQETERRRGRVGWTKIRRT